MNFFLIRRWSGFAVGVVMIAMWMTAHRSFTPQDTLPPKRLQVSNPVVQRPRLPPDSSSIAGHSTGRPWEDVPEWNALTPRARLLALLSKPFAISSQGAIETIELARDEVFLSKAGGGFKKITAQADATSMLQKSDEIAAAEGVAPCLIFYPLGQAHTAQSRRILNGRVLIHVETTDTITVTEAAKAAGCMKASAIAGLRNYVVAEDQRFAGASLLAAAALSSQHGVDSALPMLGRALQRASSPTKATYFDQQWHLRNTGRIDVNPTTHVNVLPAWNAGVTGKSVVIGIVDDAIQVDHPDFSPHYLASASADFVSLADLSHRDDEVNEHGTAVAGLAAGSGVGVAGVAPDAAIAALWLLGSGSEDESQIAASIAFKNDVIGVKNFSLTLPQSVNTLGTVAPVVLDAMDDATRNGRDGKGQVMVFAAGNDDGGSGFQRHKVGLQGNKSGLSNNYHAIAISAVAATGQIADYSITGAHLTACAPSDGNTFDPQMVTTDRFSEPLAASDHFDIGFNQWATAAYDLSDRRYTSKFTGTSAAAGVASGVVALILDANPNLGWRDVKEILLRTGTVPVPGEAGWVSRAGGKTSLPAIKHHHSYGGGLVNAGQAVALAQTWKNIGPETVQKISVTGPINLPDASAEGTTTSVEIPFDFTNVTPVRVEAIEVLVDMRHTARGDVAINLVSPAGTISNLAFYTGKDRPDTNDDDSGYQNWVFSTTRHWGESSLGKWKVVFTDSINGGVGYVEHVEVRLHGAAAPPATVDTVASSQDSIFKLGSRATLQVVATGIADRTVQWIKGNTTIAIGSSDTYTVAKMAAAATGIYTARVSNLTGTDQTVINIGMVDVTPHDLTFNEGATIVLQASAAGPGITYQWMKNGVKINNDDPRVSGTVSSRLTVTKAATSDADSYTCEVRVGRARAETGVFNLHVRIKPQIASFEFNPTIVSENMAFSVPIGDTPSGVNGLPTRFTVTGLPLGLVYNPTNGRITGRPIEGRATPYQITITASNAAGSSTVTKELTVAPPLATTFGAFAGLASPDPLGNEDLGGSFNVVCAPTGVFTGRLTLGPLAYEFAGRLDTDPDHDPHAVVQINRQAKQAPMQLAFSINRTDGHLTGDLSVERSPTSAEAFSVAVEARQNPFSRTHLTGPLAAQYNGWVEAPSAPMVPQPEGVSWASLTINSVGGATWIGRLSDGSLLTSSSSVGKGGELPLYCLLYGGKGTIQGWATATAAVSPALNTLGGTMRWVKHPPLSRVTRSYLDGFVIEGMALTGDQYVKPSKGNVMWGMSKDVRKPNATLHFAKAGIEASASYPNLNGISLRLPPAIDGIPGQTAQVFPPNPTGLNLAMYTLGGWFSGSATLREGPPSKVIRPLWFTGLMNNGARKGRGYFIIPQLPNAPDSALLSGELELSDSP